MDNKSLPEEIMELLKKRAEADHEYINPHFLIGMTSLIYDYYDLEDDVVDKWVNGMWSA